MKVALIVNKEYSTTLPYAGNVESTHVAECKALWYVMYARIKEVKYAC